MEFPWFAVLGFAVAGSVTPGPNTIMVAAAAANHGVRRTVPHMLGISIGFPLMVVLVGLGLAGPLAAHPSIQQGLRWVALAWVLWLAFKVARSAGPGEGDGRPPLGFVGGALFQWVNPKAWMLALGSVATYAAAGEHYLVSVIIIAALFAAVCFPCTWVWATFGAAMRQLLSVNWRLRLFNVTMAVLLVASVLPVVLG